MDFSSDANENSEGLLVKCRPPGNRDPQPQEQDACFGWLERQLRLLQPSIIVCLGRIAAMRLIRPDFRMASI